MGALQQLIDRRRRIRDLLSPERSPANLLGTDWSRRYRSHYMGHFLKRLSLIVATGGGHIEHRFDYCFWCYMYIIILTCFLVEIQNLDNKSK